MTQTLLLIRGEVDWVTCNSTSGYGSGIYGEGDAHGVLGSGWGYGQYGYYSVYADDTDFLDTGCSGYGSEGQDDCALALVNDARTISSLVSLAFTVLE